MEESKLKSTPKIKRDFKFLWCLHYIKNSLLKPKISEIKNSCNFDLMSFIDYSRFDQDYLDDLKNRIGTKQFNKEFPFGKEEIEIINCNNIKIIHFKHFPRQSGKTRLCAEFCKFFKNSIYFHNSAVVAKHKAKAHGIKTGRCSRPRDLQTYSGQAYDAICIDDLGWAEHKNITSYIAPLMHMSANPCYVLIIN